MAGLSPKKADFYSTLVRTSLKSTLTLRRGRPSIRGGLNAIICSQCGESVQGAPDMHEHLITRGDVSGHPEQWRIFDRRNVTLTHPGGNTSPCHSRAQFTKEGYEDGLLDIITHEGLEETLEWIESLRPYFRGVVERTLREVEETVESFFEKERLVTIHKGVAVVARTHGDERHLYVNGELLGVLTCRMRGKDRIFVMEGGTPYDRLSVAARELINAKISEKTAEQTAGQGQ